MSEWSSGILANAVKIGRTGNWLKTMSNLPALRQRLAAGALAVLFAGVIGHATGWRLARGLRNLVPGPIRWIDSLAGTLVGVLTVALFVWIVVPPFSSARGWPQKQASESIATLAKDTNQYYVNYR